MALKGAALCHRAGVTRLSQLSFPWRKEFVFDEELAPCPSKKETSLSLAIDIEKVQKI